MKSEVEERNEKKKKRREGRKEGKKEMELTKLQKKARPA